MRVILELSRIVFMYLLKENVYLIALVLNDHLTLIIFLLEGFKACLDRVKMAVLLSLPKNLILVLFID